MVLFQKQVNLHNPRLNLIYYVLITGFIVVYTIIVFANKHYTQAYFIGDNIWTRLNIYGIEGGLYSNLSQGFASAKHWDLCKNPHRYDYWPHPDGTDAYKNYTCIDLCRLHEFQEDCITRYELISDQTEESVVFVTAIDLLAIGNRSAQRYFVAYDTSKLHMGFAYGTRSTRHGWLDMGERRTDEIHDSLSDILTVIKDYKGDEKQVIEPNQDFVNLPLNKVLEWAGAPSTLEQPFDNAKANYNPERASNKVIPRIMGFNVKASVECYNEPPSHGDWASKGPVCYVGFEAFSGPWVGESFLGARDAGGQLQPKTFHGIRLFFIKGGFYKYPRFGAIWPIIIEMIVLSQIPKIFVLFLACYCMGHLSKIHHRVVHRTFNLMHECKGVAARLMTYSLDFLALSNHRSRITKAVVAERVAAAVLEEQGTLDHFEVMGLINYCFHSMLTDKGGELSWWKQVAQDFAVGCSCKRRKVDIELGEIKSLVRLCFKHYDLMTPGEEHINRLYQKWERKQDCGRLNKEQCVNFIDCFFRMYFIELREYYEDAENQEDAHGMPKRYSIDLERYHMNSSYEIPEAWIEVSGAGNERANGRYLRGHDARHDKEVWIKHGDPGHRIQWSAHSEAWNIDSLYGATRTSLYRCQQKSDRIPHKGRWRAFQGVRPIPQIKFQDFTSMYREHCDHMQGIIEKGAHQSVIEKNFDICDRDDSGLLPWNRGIGRSQFNRCCCNDEVIEFADLVQLFNVDRKLGIFEQCFDTSNFRAVHAVVDAELYDKQRSVQHAINGHSSHVDDNLQKQGKKIDKPPEGHMADMLHSRLFHLEEFAMTKLDFKPETPEEETQELINDGQDTMGLLPSIAEAATDKVDVIGAKSSAAKPVKQKAHKYRWRMTDGYIPRGGDLTASPETMTVKEAKIKAESLPGCVGFCHRGPPTQSYLKVSLYFKDKANVVVGENEWTSYLKEDAEDSFCCGFMKKTKKRPSVKATRDTPPPDTEPVTQVRTEPALGAGVGAFEDDAPQAKSDAHAKDAMDETPKEDTPEIPSEEIHTAKPTTGGSIFSGIEV